MLVMGGVFATLAIGLWQLTGMIFYLYNFTIIGVSLVLGMGLWPLLPQQHKPWARRLSQLLVGGYMFFGLGMGLIYLLFGVISPENMQIEGFWFWLLGGISAASVMHYLIAKIVGPFIFNRGWCGWSCWTVALLDFLPWKKSAGRVSRRWEHLRYLHFVLGLGLVLILNCFYDYGLPQTLGMVGDLPELTFPVSRYATLWEISELWWFLGGNLAYFGVGILLAWRLRDNRAFCKYFCPVAVFLKLGSRASLVKIGADSEACTDCKVCEKHCPMDIRLTEYIQQGRRVTCSECILCLTCTSVCPQQALQVTFGGDLGTKDLVWRRSDYFPRDRATRPQKKTGPRDRGGRSLL